MSEELGHVPEFVRLKAMDCFVLRNKHMEKFIVCYLSIFTILGSLWFFLLLYTFLPHLVIFFLLVLQFPTPYH